MPVTEAQAKDIYNVIENAIVAILRAQSGITTLLGKADRSIEANLRNEPRDYRNDELPAIAVECPGASDADPEADGNLREIVKRIDLNLFVIHRGGDRGKINDRLQTIVATTEHFLRKQINTGSELNVQLGGGSQDAIVKVASTNLIVDKGNNEFEAVMTISASVELDVCVDI